ncbi:MAG: iron-sulfur cluster assembly protein, partial [Candidatus Aenigmatarchaeota archaeon]
DPEFGTPVTEMDLIDEIEIEGDEVSVVYHLTAPMCPPPFALNMGEQIREYVSDLEDVEKVNVRVENHMQEEQLNQRLKEEE